MATCEDLEIENQLLRRYIHAQAQSRLNAGILFISGNPGQGTEPGRYEE